MLNRTNNLEVTFKVNDIKELLVLGNIVQLVGTFCKSVHKRVPNAFFLTRDQIGIVWRTNPYTYIHKVLEI